MLSFSRQSPLRSSFAFCAKPASSTSGACAKFLTHLCRLRYFGNEDAWSLSFFTYSNERYEPCVFHNGSFHGTPEEAFDVGAAYL